MFLVFSKKKSKFFIKKKNVIFLYKKKNKKKSNTESLDFQKKKFSLYLSTYIYIYITHA